MPTVGRMVEKSILRKMVDVKGVTDVALTYVEPAGAATVTMAENMKKAVDVIKEAENVLKEVRKMEIFETTNACMPRAVNVGPASRIMSKWVRNYLWALFDVARKCFIINTQDGLTNTYTNSSIRG